MIEMDLQLFGGRGSSSGGGGGGAQAQQEEQKSPTSTNGKMVQQSSDQWYGENDNGSYAVILDAGKSDYNLYKYGNKQIYEVDRGLPTSLASHGDNPSKLYAYTKAEAMNYAKGWLKANKNK